MLERPELKLIKQNGFSFNDPFEVVTEFERQVAKYIGSPYAIAVDCCSHALELSLRFLQAHGSIEVPRRTYLSVPMVVKKLNCEIKWTDEAWVGSYKLNPYPVIDASVHFAPRTYQAGTLTCLSFQQKKVLPIGRGGMILTDNAEAARWLTCASYDGRQRGKAWKEDKVATLGYHYYMTPEDAARGILLLAELKSASTQISSFQQYPDISKLEVFR